MKKIFFVALAFLLVLSSSLTISNNAHAESTTTFKDVKANTETGKAIYSMVKKGVLSGYPDGTFKPNQPITNSQAAKMIAGALNFTYDEISGPYYTDVPASHPNFKYIMALKDTFIFQPNTGKQFKPNEQLNRQQMAKILVEAYALYITKDQYVELPFTDITSDAQKNVVMPLYVHNITKGKTATKFGRNDPVTRGQFATFIYRIEQKIAKGELTGRQATLVFGMQRGEYKDVQLKDMNGKDYTNQLKLEKTNFEVDSYSYKGVPFGVYVSSYEQSNGIQVERVHEVGSFNNRLLSLSGMINRKEGSYIYVPSIIGDLREDSGRKIQLLKVDATLAPSIHSTYEQTISIEEKDVNGEKQFHKKILKAGRTIVQYTYLVDGVKKTKNVYYVTGFFNEEPYKLYYKTVEVQ